MAQGVREAVGAGGRAGAQEVAGLEDQGAQRARASGGVMPAGGGLIFGPLFIFDFCVFFMDFNTAETGLPFCHNFIF